MREGALREAGSSKSKRTACPVPWTEKVVENLILSEGNALLHTPDWTTRKEYKDGSESCTEEDSQR